MSLEERKAAIIKGVIESNGNIQEDGITHVFTAFLPAGFNNYSYSCENKFRKFVEQSRDN